MKRTQRFERRLKYAQEGNEIEVLETYKREIDMQRKRMNATKNGLIKTCCRQERMPSKRRLWDKDGIPKMTSRSKNAVKKRRTESDGLRCPFLQISICYLFICYNR